MENKNSIIHKKSTRDRNNIYKYHNIYKYKARLIVSKVIKIESLYKKCIKYYLSLPYFQKESLII